MSYLTWVLGTKLRFSGRLSTSLTAEPSLQSLSLLFRVVSLCPLWSPPRTPLPRLSLFYVQAVWELGAIFLFQLLFWYYSCVPPHLETSFILLICMSFLGGEIFSQMFFPCSLLPLYSLPLSQKVSWKCWR